VLAAMAFGALVSSFIKTQVAATFAAAIIAIILAVNFSGLLVPVSSLSGGGRLIGLGFPSTWYQQISAGTFIKDPGFAELVLAGCAVLFIAASIMAAKAGGLRCASGSRTSTASASRSCAACAPIRSFWC
jgi:ribosome-dependent ATPase